MVEFNADNAWDWAAALTYYGILSIFPGLLVVVSLVGIVRRSAVQPLIGSLTDVTPGPVRTILTEAVRGLQDSPRQAGLFAILGLLIALWSASGYAGAFIRAANAAYDVPEGRPVWRTWTIRIGVTMVTGLLLVARAIIVVVTGNLASSVGRALNLESTTITIWNIAKWPVLVVLVTVMFAVLYWASPNARQGRLPVGKSPQDRRRRAVVGCVGGLRPLCSSFRLLRQDVRHVGRRGRLPHLAVDHQSRAAARS